MVNMKMEKHMSMALFKLTAGLETVTILKARNSQELRKLRVIIITLEKLEYA